MSFIPHPEKAQNKIIYYEDAAADNMPGRGTMKSPDDLLKEIKALLTKLGAYRIEITTGEFEGIPRRTGYQIAFNWDDAKGRIYIAALPLKALHPTPTQKRQAMACALYLMRDKLESAVWSGLIEPDQTALIPYLIGDGNQTIAERVASYKQTSFKQLTGGK